MYSSYIQSAVESADVPPSIFILQFQPVPSPHSHYSIRWTVFTFYYSQLMCPPLSFSLEFQPAPPSPTPTQYSTGTVQTCFTQMSGGVGGVGGGNPSIIFVMTQ